MSFSGTTSGANLYTQGFGSYPENVEVPVVTNVDPSSQNFNYPIGKRWINTSSNNESVLTSVSTAGGVSTATWVSLGGGSSQVSTLTGDTGTATPSGGNIKIAGTANQITTAASGSTVTLSLPSSITTPGSLTATTSLSAGTTVTGGTGVTATTGNVTATAGAVNAGTSMTATLGNITATNGNLVLGTAGNKIVSTSVASTTTAGANSFGTVTLVGGTATISTTAVTANSIIMLTRQSVGSTGAAALGMLSVGTITAATSFVINAWSAADATALAATDVSVIGWMIIN